MRTAQRCWDGMKAKFVEDGRSEQDQQGGGFGPRSVYEELRGRWPLRHRRRAGVQKESNERRIDAGSRRDAGR